MESEVRELLVEELKDAYSAEKQALRYKKWTVAFFCGCLACRWGAQHGTRD